MAVIGRIRKHSGLLIIIIGVALAGFVLQDFMRKSNRGGPKLFAKIAGEKLVKADFDARVDQQVLNYKKQSGKENLTSAENFQIMTMTFDQVEKEMIMQKEYEALGLAIDHEKTAKASISPEELYDLFAGKNLHPYILQSFTDPKTGQVDRNQINNILQNFDQLKDEDKAQWKQLEQSIKDDRINQKYNNLITQGYYVPQALAKKSYEESNRIAKLRFFGIKYQSISDSSITLTDEDYQKFYDLHKNEYQQEASVDFDYVVFDVIPSAEDNKKIKEDVTRIYTDFEKAGTSDLENFVNANSDFKYDSTFHKKHSGKLPVMIDSALMDAEVGTMVPPYIENGSYLMARLVQTMDRPDSIKASQIMIMYKEAPGAQQGITRTKAQAKVTIDSIMAILKKDPSQFSVLARAKSEFPKVQEDGGDLGWMTDGDANFKFFYDSCLYAKPGELKIITSNVGYHILYVGAKTKPVKKIKVAMVVRDIKPSTQTYNTYFAKASEFAGANRTIEAFNKAVTDKGLNKRQAQYKRPMDNDIPGIESAREIIRWAFDEKTEKGAVSEQVFDCQGKYVVSVLVIRRDKGIAPLDQVKTYIEPLVKREKKADKIIANVNSAMGTTKDLYALGTKFSSVVDTLDYLTFTSYNFPNFGPEPEVIGTLFTLQKNVVSPPIKGTAGVFVINLDQVIEPPAAQNYNGIKVQMASYFKSRVSQEVYNAIKDKSEIEDNRIFYY
ncbi:MAG: peptidylprolyl isomerase [Bacteroidota bacterium]